MSRSLVTSTGVARRAFTLIELMVVMLIIGIIIAIVLPALGMVRIAARNAATKAMMSDITAAVGRFANDNNSRMPGYFTPRQMASQVNMNTRGWAAMQNVMLDLAGFATGTTMIGPGTAPADQVGIDPTLLGVSGQSTSKLYWTPDAKHWVAQNMVPGVSQVAVPENYNLPSVIDDHGNPFLVWVQDDTAVGKVTQETDFAKVSVQPTDASARFYWAPNAAFLKSGALGRRGFNQIDASEGSMVRGGASDIEKSLCGALGNPSYPYRAVPPTGVAPTVPAAARAPFIIQSAGGDGVFFGLKDRGARQFTGYIDYQLSFVKTPGTPESPPNTYLDKDGKREIIDIVTKFDDLFATAGN
jgi:prepilin-type N-terminal cleavage/methylation domain-containing protein